MGVAYNPRIITNGLILHLDAGNYHKSYPTEKQLITSGSNLVTINSSSPTSGGVQYASIHATGWNLTNGQIPRYSYVALTYTISSNTALNSSGQAITTGTLQGTQFGPGDIIDNSLPGVPLSQGTHTLYFSADGEVYAPNSAERRVLYVAVSSAISSGSIVISSAKLLYANKIYDMSGGGSNGTLTNGPTYNSSNGGSLTFDGIDDFTDITATTNTFSADFSVSGWYYATINTGGYRVLFETNGYRQATGGIAIYQFDNYFRIWRSNHPSPASYTELITTSAGTVGLNEWKQFVLTRSSGALTFYLNSVSSGTYSTDTKDYYAGNLTGKYNLGGGRTQLFYKGNISQVSIYNRALTSSEVQQNFNATRGRYGI